MFANLSPLIWTHLLAALLALGLGGWQLVASKGTRPHRLLGLVYVAAMIVANVGALTSYRMTGQPNIFHVLAVVSLATLTFGMLAMRRWRRTGDPAVLRQHKINMAYSYLGLVMAGVSQIAANPRFGFADPMSPIDYWLWLLAINTVMYGLGSWWIFASAGRPAVSGR